MTVPSNKYGPENQTDLRGQLVVMDQIAIGAVGTTKTATASSGAATLNSPSGVVTTESLSTAAGALYTLTLTNSCIAAADIVLLNVGLGTNSTGHPDVVSVTPAAGSVSVVVKNTHGSAAFNGTLIVQFAVIKI
jgi:hypothetical protein